jgi:hypothetical protein
MQDFAKLVNPGFSLIIFAIPWNLFKKPLTPHAGFHLVPEN